MGKTLILKTPPEIPEHDLLHAHNIHFTTYSKQYGFFGSAIGQHQRKATKINNMGGSQFDRD
jgi:hypothetical protein